MFTNVELTCHSLSNGINLIGPVLVLLLVTHGDITVGISRRRCRRLLRSLGRGHDDSHLLVAVLGCLLALGLLSVLAAPDAVLNRLLAVIVWCFARHG